MKAPLFGTLCAVAMAFVSISSPSLAQQHTAIIRNTVKECLDEWRTNSATSQAEGITKQDYVAQCREGFVPARTVALAGATSPDTNTVTRRSSSKGAHSAAPAATEAVRSKERVHSAATATAEAAGAKKRVHSAALAMTVAVRARKRVHSAAPALTAAKPKAVTRTPSGSGEYEGWDGDY